MLYTAIIHSNRDIDKYFEIGDIIERNWSLHLPKLSSTEYFRNIIGLRVLKFQPLLWNFQELVICSYKTAFSQSRGCS